MGIIGENQVPASSGVRPVTVNVLIVHSNKQETKLFRCKWCGHEGGSRRVFRSLDGVNLGSL